ncbi:HTH-type dhaKLM operon transcriptional activator DhaS [Clostridiales bacterium]|nr:HTH-type dhaKLM operon transcriptional activator DhaS [Clostridiales bacterium]
MSDSNLTKRALASALKELMQTKPFPKISIVDICKKCDINRKSFYYHFKDKYDLINWIYNTEFESGLKDKDYNSELELVEEVCTYFYNNRDFYKRALMIEGQNSFLDYFRGVFKSLLTKFINNSLPCCKDTKFYVEFYTDAFVISIVSWVKDKEEMPPEEYVTLLKACLLDLSKVIVSQFENK